MDKYLSRLDLYFIKENVSQHEHEMQKYLYKLDVINIPKILHYDPETRCMAMTKINGMSISDMYGEDIENVPNKIYNKVLDIMRILILFNVCYPDFTGYNFIIEKKTNKIWIIDFEHAYCETEISNEFVLSLLDGKKTWNSEFA